jgi:hypothetical protein
MVQRKIVGAARGIAAWGSGSRRARAAIRPRETRRLTRFGALPLLVVAVGIGAACQDRECEAARLELARTWETLRDTATSRKQIPEGSNLSPDEERERIRVWTTIEERAELMRSSFETPQVTWPSAEKARADLGEAFKPLATKEDPMTRGFALTLNEADQHMANFRKSCR